MTFARALLLPLLAAVLERSLHTGAAPSPRQKAPVQFRCEYGAVWMENCNECRCQRDNHVVCAHLACLRGRVGPAGQTSAPQKTACYQGACAAECVSRVDDGGCRLCDCGVAGDEVLSVTAQTPEHEGSVRYSFLSAARSLRSRHPRP